MDATESVVDRLLAITMLLGLALYFWGTALNMTVVIANNGSMHVVEEVEGSAILDYDEKARHIADASSAKLILLGDLFQVDLPDMRVQSNLFQQVIDTWGELLNYPPKGGMNLVSIGDIMRWTSSALFLFMLPFLFVRIPFRLARDGIRFRR